jgi:uncharacterized membrane protein HdeD (DUF308 family)
MSADSVASTIRRRSDWAMVMGVVTVIIGVFMMLYPFATATATTIFFGWSLIIAAVANFIFAFSAPSAAPFFLKVLLAIVYGVAGAGLLANPLLGVAALTLALGTMLIIQSGIELAVAILYRKELPWGWMLLDSLVSLGLGLMIVFQWPVSSIWVVGTMVGAGVLFAGVTRIIVAAGVHQGATQFEKLVNA